MEESRENQTSKRDVDANNESTENETQQRKKPDIKSLVSVIPPAGVLKKQEKKLFEKRIRVRYGPIKPDQVKINKKLADELGIKDYAELVVAGRKKFRLKVIIDENVPDNVVIANEELLREQGVADNSISTIRRALS